MSVFDHSRRTFDHDDARQRHRDGESIRQIAASLSVSPSAVWKALHPEYETQRPPTGDAECDDCGGAMNAASRAGGARRCRSCAAKERWRLKKEAEA